MNQESIEGALVELNDMIELCNSIFSLQKDKQWNGSNCLLILFLYVSSSTYDDDDDDDDVNDDDDDDDNYNQ